MSFHKKIIFFPATRKKMTKTTNNAVEHENPRFIARMKNLSLNKQQTARV